MKRTSLTSLARVAAPIVVSLSLVAHSSASSGAQPDQMRAVRIHEYGGAGNLTVDTVPIPTPAKGEMVVRVRAAGVNPVDWKIREGYFRDPSMELPLTLGFDVAGVVHAVGPGVTAFKPGDEVFAYLSLRRGGGYAEYAIVTEQEAAAKPASIDFSQAAGVPLAALTAWQALVETADLQPGQTVLIHGAAGGVGSLAVQIAKARGATVIGTASEANHAFLREIGVDTVIDYRTQKFEELVSNVDVVLDPIGGETQDRSFGVVKKGGIIISIVGPVSAEKAAEAGIRGAAILVRPDGAQLAEIGKLVDAGKIKPVTSHTFPLAEAAKAHGQSESGHTRGKIVLSVSE